MPATKLGAVPARTVLPHRIAANPLVPSGHFDACRASRSPPPPRRTIDADTVIHRLEEAGHTLLSLPDSGHTTSLRQTRHQYVAEALGAYMAAAPDRPRPPIPPAARITRMDQSLAWIPLIPTDKLVLRRIVGCRCLVSPLTGKHLFTWRRLARLLGADHKAIGRWHATGIDLIVATLNRDAALVAAWDTLG